MGKKCLVGICSRDPKESYDWIQDLLKTERFKKKVKDTPHPIYISNSNSSEFMKMMSNCTFTILYHTKNRGRINITDVTDSLYDAELELMCKTQGRDNVIVVIDDLDDSGSDEAERILRTQESIKKWSCELFLFSKQDKVTIADGKSTDGQVDKKLSRLREILKKAKKKQKFTVRGEKGDNSHKHKSKKKEDHPNEEKYVFS
ncbi:uncharacterized protein LOC128642362 [Bombina bombina]|uniref:uncharacterized protein LOC128642362 n=1 Tax=Bombina bombina TaxID=8345 RepID=UPI00235A5238|nr:uncharacterized protein LOC128642362 [Bombina bombina]